MDSPSDRRKVKIFFPIGQEQFEVQKIDKHVNNHHLASSGMSMNSSGGGFVTTQRHSN